MFNFRSASFFIFIFFQISSAQIIWTKYAGNPVLTPGINDAWDAGLLQVDAVQYDGETYHMWYTSLKDRTPPASIGYATSPDGITWIKYESNPVFSPGGSVTVLISDSLFHMWYGRTDDSGDSIIGYATSQDGINWNIYPENPVLSPGVPGSWDELGVQQPSVLFDEQGFHMWYHSPTGSGSFKIGYASSEDGIDWVKSDDPVLLFGESGTWDDSEVISPNVVKKDSVFHMLYQGSNGQVSRLGYAVSDDGIVWSKSESNPVLGPGMTGSWEEQGIASPTLLFDGSIFHLWYSGVDYDNNWQIGYASTTLTNSLENPNNQLYSYNLSQNYPNPFNPVTTFSYQLRLNSDVELSIYNLLGQKVAILVDKRLPAGNYNVHWNAAGFSSGVYIYTLETNTGFKQSRKLLLIK